MRVGQKTPGLFAGLCALACLAASPAPAKEKPAEIIAAHVRIQGHTCDKPKSAVREKNASRPDEAAWLLVCANAAYRVRLIPHLADKIELVDAPEATAADKPHKTPDAGKGR